MLALARLAWLLAVGALALNVCAILATGDSPAWLPGEALGGGRLGPAALALGAAILVGLPLGRPRAAAAAYGARPAVALFCVLLAVYLANDRTIGSGDTLPARYLPVGILRSGSFLLDDFPALYGGGVPYYLERARGHYVSAFPVGAALLALPLYVPNALAGDPVDPGLLEQLEKLAAAAVVALSAVVLHAALRLLCSPVSALILTLVYGLGTSSLSVSSQGLWQHGPSQLALAAVLYCLVRGRTAPGWSDASALPMAFAVVCRPTDLVIVAPLALCAAGRASWRFGPWALAPLAFQAWYNLMHFGHALHTQWPLFDRGVWSMALPEGLAGMLLSPGRGLLVYSPVFAFSLVGMARAWWPGGDRLYRMLGLGVVAHVLLYSTWHTWYAGLYYGPRYHADLAPSLTALMVPALGWLRRSAAARGLFAVLALWSVAAHAAGVVPNERAAAQFDSRRILEALRSWETHPLVGFILEAGRQGAAALRGLPASDAAPALVRARFETPVVSPVEAPPGAALHVPVGAVNTGGAVWTPGEGPGAAGLEWHWARANKTGAPPHGPGGRLLLRHRVLPGGRYAFVVAAPAPAEPGRYGLRVALASPGHLAAFSTVLVAEIMDAPHRPAFPLLGAESLAISTATSRPRVAVALDRDTYAPGSRLRVGLEAENPPGAPARDLYVGIAPEFAPVLVFFAGPRTITTPVPIGDAAAFVRMRMLHGGARLRDDRFFELPVNRYLAAGTYRVFAALIPAGTQLRLPWEPAAASVRAFRVVH